MGKIHFNYLNKNSNLIPVTGNPLTVVGSPVQETDQINLNGEGSFYFDVNTKNSITTYIVQIYITQHLDNKIIFSCEEPGTYYYGYSLRALSDGSLRFLMGHYNHSEASSIKTTWKNTYNSSKKLSINKWYTIKLVVDYKNGEVNVYVDDDIFITGEIDTRISNSQKNVLGVCSIANYNYADYRGKFKLKNMLIWSDEPTIKLSALPVKDNKIQISSNCEKINLYLKDSLIGSYDDVLSSFEIDVASYLSKGVNLFEIEGFIFKDTPYEVSNKIFSTICFGVELLQPDASLSDIAEAVLDISLSWQSCYNLLLGMLKNKGVEVSEDVDKMSDLISKVGELPSMVAISELQVNQEDIENKISILEAENKELREELAQIQTSIASLISTLSEK